MKRFFFYAIFSLLFILSGCGDGACYDKLKEVDSLTEKNLVDSAQKILETIELTYKIRDEKEQAYYSLLKYQLQFRHQYKGCNHPTNDSLIDYSIAYYKKHIDNNKLALCYYLKGRTSENKDAIKYLKKAENYILNTNNNSLKMRIYCCISIINNENEDYITSLKYELKAIDCGERAVIGSKNPTDIENLMSCYINISDTYNNLGKSDSCIFYATRCLKYLDYAPDDQKSYIYLNAAAAIEDIDSIKAKEYALKSLEIRKSNNAYQILAKIARDNKDYKLSEAYLNEALKYSPSIDWEAFILYELANTKTLMGEHEEAARISKEVHRLRDSVEYLQAQDSIKELQMAADLEYKSQTVVEEKDNRTVIVVGTLSAILIIVIAAYVTKKRKLKHSVADNKIKADAYENEIKKMVEENRQLEKETRKKDKTIEVIKKEKEAALRQQTRLKADGAKRQQENEMRNTAGRVIYNKVKDGTGDTVVWNKENEMSLIAYYQIVSSTFKEDMKTVYAGMKSRKLVVFVLKDMGLTNANIAKMLSISEGAVRTQLSRINKTASLKSLYGDEE